MGSSVPSRELIAMRSKRSEFRDFREMLANGGKSNVSNRGIPDLRWRSLNDRLGPTAILLFAVTKKPGIPGFWLFAKLRKFTSVLSSVPTFFRGERAVEAQIPNVCRARLV